MDKATPLPDILVERYRDWRTSLFEARRSKYLQLAQMGQSPQVMIISCCDSRVLVAEMFGAEAGDYFVHRNIAALVPPYAAPGAFHGTLSTIQFAVEALNVKHILVVGHSGCGGVAACHDMCSEPPEPTDSINYVAAWLQILKPCVERVQHLPDRSARLAALEREGVVLSLRNLISLPFVRAKVDAGHLQLHGAWKNIGGHELEIYDPARGFVLLPV